MLIAVQEQAEWEPGLPRQMRQITLAADGKGQVVVFEDDRPVKIAGFDYSAEAFSRWYKGYYHDFSNNYIEESMTDDLIIEGNPALFSLFFVSPDDVKIIDVEQQGKYSPQALLELVQQLQSLAASASPVALEGYYLRALPFDQGQSQEVQDAHAVSHVKISTLPKEVQQVLLTPLQLIPFNKKRFVRLEKDIGLQEDSGFIYLEHASGNVVRIDLSH